MVYDKKKSGDPDYDDKVPLEDHFGVPAKDADGNDVLVTESVGPVKADGSHANLEEPVDARDNRPREGGEADEASEVQIVDGDAAKEKHAGEAKQRPSRLR